MKQGSLSPHELDGLVSVLELAGGKLGQSKSLERKPREGNARVPSGEKLIASLESMGVRVYGLDEAQGYSPSSEISWDYIAGYDLQKRYVRTRVCFFPCLLLFLFKFSILFFLLNCNGDF